MANSLKKKDLSQEEMLDIYDSWPQEAKDIMFAVSSADEIKRTVEMYGLKTPSEVADNVGAVMLGTISLNNLPSFIEMDAKVERRVALQVVTRVSRHILKPFSQYVDIGNVDAYVEEWTEELSKTEEFLDTLDKKSKKINPDSAGDYLNLGNDYGKLGKYEEAINAYKEAIKLKPDYANAYYNLGFYYSRLERFKEAIIAFKESIRFKPDDESAHCSLGSAYSRLEMDKEAIDAFKKAIKTKPDYVRAHYNLGLTYLFLNNSNAALEEYRILKDIDPQKADELNKEIVKFANTIKEEVTVQKEEPKKIGFFKRFFG